MKGTRDIVILGTGKVGTALGVLAARAGRRVVAVADADAAAARDAAKAIGAAAAEAAAAGAGAPSPPVLSPADAAARGQVVLLTVPDEAIEGLCAELAAQGAFACGAVVAHCSGALGSDVLAVARDSGCRVGSMHPLQTFPSVEAAVGALPGSWYLCEGDEGAVAELSALAEAIGGRSGRIAPGGKALYHAAAATACNSLAALLDAAVAMAEAAGVGRDEALEAMAPLVRATVENVLAIGPEAALTGPVARGDAATVARHLDALAAAVPGLAELYRALALRTADLARRKGTDPDALARIERILSETLDGDEGG